MASIMRIGGGSGQPNVLTVAVDTGAIVTATNGDKTVVGTSVGGNAVLKLPKGGTWLLVAELNGQTTEDVIEISDYYPVDVAFGLPMSSLAVGALVRMKENGADVNYRVVHQGLPSSMYDESCDGTWVLREAIRESGQWHVTATNDYQNSAIHSYLNSTFIELFDSNTQAVIKQVKIPYVNGTGKSGSVASGTNGLVTKAFLVSGYELGWTTSNNSNFYADGACLSYFSGTAAIDAKRIGYLNGAATIWWLRSANKGNNYYCWLVGTDGSATYTSANQVHGIRPSMVFDNSAMVTPTPNADGSYTLIV